MLSKILKFVVIGNVISVKTHRLKVPFLKQDHPFACVAEGNVGTELKLFDLFFDSLDRENRFSNSLFIENLRKCEIVIGSNIRSDYYRNLTTCEGLFRLSALGFIRNCFDKNEFERLIQESFSLVLMTHGSPVALISGLLIASSVSYILRNGDLKHLQNFLVENILNHRFLGDFLNERFDGENEKEYIFKDLNDVIRNAVLHLKNSLEVKNNDIEEILMYLKENKCVISNFTCALNILPLLNDYLQMAEYILSNFYVTEFFSTFLSLLYGIVNTEDNNIAIFDEPLEKNEQLKDFLNGLNKKMDSLVSSN